MPKKRNHNFKQLQGSSSTADKQAASNRNSDGGISVNERLSELRKLEAKDAAAKKRQLAESVNQRSVPVPPELRAVMGVSEYTPPKPKGNARTRERIMTPGPAPPRSWINGRSNAWSSTLATRPRRLKTGLTSADANNRSRPKELLRFARLTGSRNQRVDERPPTLLHLALKAVAEAWDGFDIEDYPALAHIPQRLRLRLISYIAFYGPAIDTEAVQALLQGDEFVETLDLAGLVGHGGLTLKKLTKTFEQQPEDARLGNDDSAIADSWDADESFSATIQPALKSDRLSQLTHLCLSHPAATVSWKDLLSFSKIIPQVTHLSLAYWPRPTLTPNLATAAMTSARGPDIAAGGSHFYSALDQDMSEPVSLLRQLSAHLLCLKWLDIEGCQEWMPAIARLAPNIVIPSTTDSRSGTDDWTTNSQTVQSVLSTNWKNLSYIRCAQGWLPSRTGTQALSERREASMIHAILVDGIRKHLQDSLIDPSKAEEQASRDQYDVEKRKASVWLDAEYQMTYAFMRMNALRRSYGQKAIEIDFGWIKRHSSSIQP